MKVKIENLNAIMSQWFWLIAIIDLIIIQLSSSTFDSGDSVLHYLQAKQALHYPKYFFDHWSKPLFVLISSPFAYWGYAAMKLFNSLCVLISIWLVFKIMRNKTTLAWVTVPMGLLAPELFWSQTSGLTEPLFALVLIFSIHLYLNNKFNLALIAISFLPFIRSEGWFILPLFAFVEVANKRLNSIALLLVGHLVYGAIGWLVYKDFLWMFNQNPYQGIEEKYGSGALFHFVEQTPYFLGLPLAIFFALGLIFALFQFNRKLERTNLDATVLIYGSVITFYVAHSLFWYLGLFHSFGLKRVFIAIIPLIVYIGLEGLENFLLLFKQARTRNRILILTIIIVLIFPFSKNKMALGLPQNFYLAKDQVLINDVVGWYQSSDYKGNTVSYANHYFAIPLKVDMDNKAEVLALGLAKDNQLPKGAMVFWDSYFASSDQGVEKAFFEGNKDYQKIKEFATTDSIYQVVVYLKVQ